jgi:hypothetical protein
LDHDSTNDEQVIKHLFFVLCFFFVIKKEDTDKLFKHKDSSAESSLTYRCSTCYASWK